MSSTNGKGGSAASATAASAASGGLREEEIMRRRLLFDGDGWGDDRRYKILIDTDCPQPNYEIRSYFLNGFLLSIK